MIAKSNSLSLVRCWPFNCVYSDNWTGNFCSAFIFYSHERYYKPNCWGMQFGRSRWFKNNEDSWHWSTSI